VRDYVMKEMYLINKFKIEMVKSPFWKDLMVYIKEHNINAEYISNYCKRKF